MKILHIEEETLERVWASFSTDFTIVSDKIDIICKILFLIRNINGIPSDTYKNFRIYF